MLLQWGLEGVEDLAGSGNAVGTRGFGWRAWSRLTSACRV